ncbi:hypothetical protein CAPTEDRAFT_193439 [Capitella teleta]|uniref:Uncharacterized protein n=1 Tax=Capitella teleta TaxID=283909 RepID=R7TUU6_CAPTE|nr:hypothetical protein CAPTEDRAFT_193439 [Capitella teleta]|eukprot:ELT97479.1 hypothetical protein CAPTEDRAFT_193439 [Capitella teleta]
MATCDHEKGFHCDKIQSVHVAVYFVFFILKLPLFPYLLQDQVLLKRLKLKKMPVRFTQFRRAFRIMRVGKLKIIVRDLKEKLKPDLQWNTTHNEKCYSSFIMNHDSVKGPTIPCGLCITEDLQLHVYIEQIEVFKIEELTLPLSSSTRKWQASSSKLFQYLKNYNVKFNESCKGAKRCYILKTKEPYSSKHLNDGPKLANFGR